MRRAGDEYEPMRGENSSGIKLERFKSLTSIKIIQARLRRGYGL
jgi:hypothetical protein